MSIVKDADLSECGPYALHREVSMVDFLLGFAFVAMILSPAVVASVQRARSHQSENSERSTS
jgi:hypothetical protein